MKEILMFMFEGCPHCMLANKLIQNLLNDYPQYRKIKLTQIDERINPEIADKYDYYYVPTFYVDGVKVHEGHAESEDIKKVFDTAYAE